MKKATQKFTETASRAEVIVFIIVAFLLLASLAALLARHQISSFTEQPKLVPEVIERLED